MAHITKRTLTDRVTGKPKVRYQATYRGPDPGAHEDLRPSC
jgi:hypothetical protein